jgi:hypothetical protein
LAAGAPPQPDDVFGTSEFAAAISGAPRTIWHDARLTSLTTDGTDLYLVSQAADAKDPAIIRVSVDDGSVASLATGQRAAGPIVVDHEDIYFASGADWDPDQATEIDHFKVARETRMRDVPERPRDPAKMFKVMRLPKRGGTPRVLADGLWSILELSLDSTWIYLKTHKPYGADVALYRVAKESGRREILDACSDGARLAGGGDDVYWSCGNKLSRVASDGKLIPFASERTWYRTLAAGGPTVCWATGTGWIVAAHAPGREVALARDQIAPLVTCDADVAFWSSHPGWEPAHPTIVRAPVDGGRPTVVYTSEEPLDLVFLTRRAVGWHDAPSGNLRVLGR